MRFLYLTFLIILLSAFGCKKDSKQITDPTINIEPEFSTVFEHEQGAIHGLQIKEDMWQLKEKR